MNSWFKALCILVSVLLSAAAWSEPVDINSANAEQLAQAMVGVGKVKADAIVQDREKNGRFNSVDDLSRVKGIKQNLIDKNRDKVAVSPNEAAPSADVASK